MDAESLVVLLWSVTLIVALVLTVVAVPMLYQIIRAASLIDKLLKETVPSAVQIVGHTANIKELETIVNGAGPLLTGAAAIRTVAVSISRHTRAVATALGSVQ